MSKTVLLVGHCGPDSSYLRNTIRGAAAQAQVRLADDPLTLQTELESGVDLVLFNRKLGYEFDGQMGVDWIRHLKKQLPHVKTMLVSNYPDAQAEAHKAGALPGFGKREIGSARVTQLLRDVLDGETHRR